MFAFLMCYGLHDCSMDFHVSHGFALCPVIQFSLMILAALQVPLVVTWLTVYHQLQFFFEVTPVQPIGVGTSPPAHDCC